MRNQSRKMTKIRENQLRVKYEDGTLTRAERDEWSYRLKQMRDEYYVKSGKSGFSQKS